MRRLWAPIGLALLLTGCGGGSSTPAPSPSESPATASPSGGPTSPSPSAGSPTTGSTGIPAPRVVGTVAEHLKVPWGIALLPDGSALVTERDSGAVLQILNGHSTEVGRVDQTRAEGEAGLLGIAVSPSYAQSGRVFLYVTTDTDNRVLRTTFRNGRLGALTPVLTGIPRGFIHDGGRMVFGPDKMLYVSTGETGKPELAQDPSSLGGKILRITEDGKPAPGNPRPASPVWTLGHRNVQGLAFDDQGRLWASEFGANTWDELNLIVKGGNYGWPIVEGKGGPARFRQPAVVWPTSQASPSGLAFADGSLWLASLRGERLWQVPLVNGRTGKPRAWFVGRYGRMRTVVTMPDGRLWLTTSNRDGRGTPAAQDDRIFTVLP